MKHHLNLLKWRQLNIIWQYTVFEPINMPELFKDKLTTLLDSQFGTHQTQQSYFYISAVLHAVFSTRQHYMR